jgi:hypothetical protein
MRIARWTIPLFVLGSQACRSEHRDAPAPSADAATLSSVPAAEPTKVGAVSIPREEWQDFIRTLTGSLERNVPQVLNDRIISIRYFPGSHSPGERIGLKSGDNLVEINENGDWGARNEPNGILKTEMERSSVSCALSFTIENAGRRRTVAARCG